MASSTVTQFAHLQIPLEDVLKATDNFHSDKIIGRGGLGQVYKGRLQRSGELIQIAALRLDREQDVEFWTEISVLSDLNHTNLVSIIGFCDEKNEKIIVTTYAANGSLKEHLNNPNLTWTQRLKICVGVAHAMSYLHYDKRRGYGVIHLNINSSTILLDENWEPKLSGFKVSIKQSLNRMDRVILSEPIGAIGYIDPASVKTKGVTHKSDIYSFGVVLFEILCGRVAYIGNENGPKRFLARLAKSHYENKTMEDIIPPDLSNQIWSQQSFLIYSNTAYSCLKEEQADRPHTNSIVEELEKALELHLQPENIDERIHPNILKVVNKPETLQLTREIPEEIIQRQNMDDGLAKLLFRHNIYRHSPGVLIFPPTYIISATNNFSGTYKIESQDGCTLYRAKLNLGMVVIIKRYPPGQDALRSHEFDTEIKILTSGVKHPNIVTLLGFCSKNSERSLVMENFSNEYLSDYLKKSKDIRILTWEKRLKICIDVAHALNYLHHEMEDQKVILHRDINSSHIVVGENGEAKIVGFRFSEHLPPNQEDEALYRIKIVGAKGYRDPEYEKSGKFKRESDVYSFGVVLFEILCGRLALDPIYNESEEGLAFVARQSFYTETLEDMIDNIIKEEPSENSFVLSRGPNKDSLHTFIEIAHQCVAETQNQRPTMKVVLMELEKALSLHKISKDNPRIMLKDINQATRNFDNANCIGKGGFGSVYKGIIRIDDEEKTIVAKRLDTRFGQGEQQFLSELQILLEYKHENVIGLVGYCDEKDENEKDENIIVYEYASKGSLDRCLNDASLTWVKRLNICIDVARALDFLHGGVGKQAKVIHRDIKTANILLNNDWKAKLADFGLSIISPLIKEIGYVIDHACGTRGYLDPLYEKSRFLTMESDIYSFGVVLFEILCGRSTFEIKEHKGMYLPDFIKNKFDEGKHDEMVFEQIKEQIVSKSLTTFQDIAYQCLHHERERRPTTKKVLSQLKKALEFQNMSSTISKCAHLQIPLEDVVKATENFHDDNIIRHSDTGNAYKGRLLRSGRLTKVAVRRFNFEHGEGDLMFWREISVLSDLQHKNLVSIIGFCNEQDEKIIVTTYEANGSLGQYLSSPTLTWTQRLRICVGVARALSYLHYDKERDYAIIHCNISSDTILLDESWEAKLSGFETLIKELGCYEDQACLCEHSGTMGYIDPAIERTGGVTYKSDVYSFGVVLFELLCGRKAFIDNESDKFLAALVKGHYKNGTQHDIIHGDLYRNKILSPQSLLKYLSIAHSCLNKDRAHRPKMDRIVRELEIALELQLRCENIGKKVEHLKIPLNDIKVATNNFSGAYKIASWGECTLYKAELDHYDKENHSSIEGENKGANSKIFSTIVIKRYHSGHDLSQEDKFFTEIEMLPSIKHPNIATLLGFCVEDLEMILIIDNVSHANLGLSLMHVRDLQILTWEKRLKICIDVAHALNHLHSKMGDQKVMIHRDICSHNIGLDENWRAKIIDFGDSVFLPPNQEDEVVYPKRNYRISYIDPEYEEKKYLKKESDVYSFGVVLFEILCWRIAYDPIYLKEAKEGLASIARQSYYKRTIENMIDPIIKNGTSVDKSVKNKGPNKNSLHTFIEIAHQCVAETQDRRPTMKTVVKELEKALFLHKNNTSRISVEKVKRATQNFQDGNSMGTGRFQKVYKGNLQASDGFKTIVAKRLDTRLSQGEQQFLSELQILLEYKHENVIGLVRYRDEKDEKLIVYEYAPKGSLDTYINDASLTWVKRLKICIDVASALDFLHEGVGDTKVIHRDIKAASILLNNDWKAKLANFGLSLISPITQEINDIDHVCGTPEYLDPLYHKYGFLTMESDIYSFGLVLFEIMCGRSTFEIHKHEGHYLPDFIKRRFEEGKHDEVVFEQIREQIMPNSLTTFQEIAYQCLHLEKEKRPKTKEVLSQLEKALEYQLSQLNELDQTGGSTESVYCWPCGFWKGTTTTLSERLLRLLGRIS